jgi:TM2 domain-containing membrane protein YozV
MNAPAEAAVYAHGITGDPRRKSPVLAMFLSVMPGLGQIYVGYYRQGFTNALVIGTIMSMFEPAPNNFVPLMAIFMAFFWLYNIVDAGRRALLYNEALAGRSGVELPEESKSPGIRGSIFGGLAVAFVGAVLLSNTLFGMSLEWVASWWPAALIVFGLYLVGRSVLDRTRPAPRATSTE